MPFTLTMPKLTPTMEEGMIAKWGVKEGDYVEVGDLLMEVATDKATVEFNAIDSGFLRKILVTDGKEAGVNQAIAIFTEKADESIEGYVPEGVRPGAQKAAASTGQEALTSSAGETVSSVAPSAAAFRQPEFVPAPPLPDYTFQGASGVPLGRQKASPLARKVSSEKGLDLTTIKGTGPGGRIMKRDPERAQPLGDFAFGRREIPSEVAGSYDEESFTPIRKVIARRLQESKTFIPHFYVQQAVNAEPLYQFRNQLRNLDLKVSFNDCVVRACALALKKHPNINSGFNSVTNAVIRFKTVDIAVAVSIPAGLVTPIVRYADFKNLGEISNEIHELAKRAKEGKLAPQEYQGGSFTISNLGMYGITNFQAIINPPQAAILAISGINDVPVVKNGGVVPGKVMNITLSVDHRVIDGVAAAEFVNTVKMYLENPSALLL